MARLVFLLSKGFSEMKRWQAHPSPAKSSQYSNRDRMPTCPICVELLIASNGEFLEKNWKFLEKKRGDKTPQGTRKIIIFGTIINFKAYFYLSFGTGLKIKSTPIFFKNAIFCQNFSYLKISHISMSQTKSFENILFQEKESKVNLKSSLLRRFSLVKFT